ncbi:HNH endonuclease [Nonomuraea sp. NPDC003754]
MRRPELLDEIGRRLFESCPICGGPPEKDEHVPPKSIGGVIMTRTCRGCNQTFGGRVEGGVKDWFYGATSEVELASENVRGSRRVGKMQIMPARGGGFLVTMGGGSEDDFRAMLLSKQVVVRGRGPDPNILRLALLKHVYLAQCLRSGVPEGALADHIRESIVAARDASRRDPMPVSPVALGLTVVRFSVDERLSASPLVAARIELPDGPMDGVIMLGRFFVSWPAYPPADIQPIDNLWIEYVLEVGDPVTGTIVRKG